jgi:hypothetical protein
MSDKDHRDIVIERVAEKMGWPKDGDNSFWHEVMDDYFKERTLELLQWMGENEVDASATCEAAKATGEQMFYYRGEWLTKESLFKSFL